MRRHLRFGSSLPSVRLLSKVFPLSPNRDIFLTSSKRIPKEIQKQKRQKHTAASAQARQEGLVHSFTHRGKGIEVTKIRRRGEPAGHEGDKERLI